MVVSVGTGVRVSVGVSVSVGTRVSVGTTLGVSAMLVAMAACAVSTTTVGKISGGKGVGPNAALDGVQPAKSPKMETRKIN